MRTIRGKIIRIVDARTVIIDLGSEHGVTQGARFSIIAEAEPIVHPDTGETLGILPVVKAKLKADRVYSKFTVAVSRWLYREFKASLGLQDFIDTVSVTKTIGGDLLIEQTELEPWKAQSETPVRKGDIVEVRVAEPRQTPHLPGETTPAEDTDSARGTESDVEEGPAAEAEEASGSKAE